MSPAFVQIAANACAEARRLCGGDDRDVKLNFLLPEDGHLHQFILASTERGMSLAKWSKLQATLSVMRHTRVIKGLISNAGPQTERARLLAVTAPKASLWLQTDPIDPELVYKNEEYQLSFRALLGLMPTKYGFREFARCGQCAASLAQNPWHGRSCPRRNGVGRTDGHHMTNRYLQLACKHLGLPVRLEPQHLVEGDPHARPDLLIQFGNESVIIDTTIVDPTCPTNVGPASRQRLGAAIKAEAEKNRRYQPTRPRSATLAGSLPSARRPLAA